jgi:hypothetical protein
MAFLIWVEIYESSTFTSAGAGGGLARSIIDRQLEITLGVISSAREYSRV